MDKLLRKSIKSLKKKRGYNSDQMGFEIVFEFAVIHEDWELHVKRMIKAGRGFKGKLKKTNLNIIKKGLFAGRVLYVIEAKCENCNELFLFYKSFKGSGSKIKNQTYPIPGFVIHDISEDYYFYVPNGWFIKDMSGIVNYYNVPLFKKISKYIMKIENER